MCIIASVVANSCFRRTSGYCRNTRYVRGTASNTLVTIVILKTLDVEMVFVSVVILDSKFVVMSTIFEFSSFFLFS